MPELCKAHPAAESADSEPVLPARAQEAPQLGRAALERALLAWWRPPWALARQCLHMIPRLLRMLARNIRPRRLPISAFTECRCCNLIPARRISDSPKPLRPDRASLSSSTKIVRP